MPHRLFDAIIWVDEGPQFELRDGLVHITQRIAQDAYSERVMSRHQFFKTVRAANAFADRIKGSDSNVVVLPLPIEDEAATG